MSFRDVLLGKMAFIRSSGNTWNLDYWCFEGGGADNEKYPVIAEVPPLQGTKKPTSPVRGTSFIKHSFWNNVEGSAIDGKIGIRIQISRKRFVKCITKRLTTLGLFYF